MGALATISQQSEFTKDQIALIKSQITPAGTTDMELAMFLAYCQRTGLDPFARQIYLSERRANVDGQWVVTRKPETTIDGFRLIAERGGQYAGQLGPFWCGEDGAWRDVWTLQQAPVAARIGVLRHDFKEPLWAVALYGEYVQTNKEGKANSMWSRMPANQLAKCAESLALRRAFPRELSGLYIREEMPDERTEAKAAQQAIVDEALEKEKLKTGDLPNGTSVEQMAHVRPLAEIESRRAAQEAEALAELEKHTVKHPPREKKAPPAVSFDMLETFAAVKKQIIEVTGADRLYYEVLKQHGYAKSNLIPDRATGVKVYKDLGKALTAAKEHKANCEELSEIGDKCATDGEKLRKFWEIMGSYSFGELQDARDSPDALPGLLVALRGIA